MYLQYGKQNDYINEKVNLLNKRLKHPLTDKKLQNNCQIYKYYSYSNATIIKILKIKSKEQRHMLVLIEKDEKNRRRRVKRRQESNAQCKRESRIYQSYILFTEGAKQKHIAEIFKLSIRTIKNYIKRGKEIGLLMGVKCKACEDKKCLRECEELKRIYYDRKKDI